MAGRVYRNPREAAEEVAGLLRQAKYAIALTGAGISADAGIPTFRGPGGLWEKYKPEELATPEAFARDPLLVWRWYAWRIRMVLRASPTVSHMVLAKLEERGMLKAVITQNVDGLHQRAGSRNVIELHGNILRARCTSCGYKWVLDKPPEDRDLPLKCPRCGSLARPDVVWFGEPLPAEALHRAIQEAARSDLVLVVGTSGVVEPAASIPLIAYERGARIVNINLEPNRYSPIAVVNYYGKAADFFAELELVLGL